MASSSSSSSAVGVIRSWRTAFLTLRDETLSFPPPADLLGLLRRIVLSHPLDVLVSAAPELPPHEVTSDVMFLVELASAASECQGVDDTLLRICRLIHDVLYKVHLEVNSSFWPNLLDYLEKMAYCFLGKKPELKVALFAARMKSMEEIIEILRLVVKRYGCNCSSSESTKLVKILLHIVSYSHVELFSSSRSTGTHRLDADGGNRNPRCNNSWELQTVAFSMIGDALSRNGSHVPADLWQSTLEVLRKVMDVWASKNFLLEGYVMARFYTALLHCLHLVLSDPKGSLSEHVAGFVAALQMFFMYGVPCKSSQLPASSGPKEKELNSLSQKCGLVESKSGHGPYRPPHLRKIEGTTFHQSSSLSPEFASSDSEHSDSDGSMKDDDRFRSSKARVAAIVCIQDLCKANPKSLTSLWTMLLPTNDVLQPRKYPGTIMACLLFDPVLKTRVAASSALATMLEGHSCILLQVAEYKESTKCGSFTTLSSSLGQILVQLHRGMLYLVQHETHVGLLASLLKVLILLISSTPYSRMPSELLPTVIASVHTRIVDGLSFKTDQIGLLATALCCLGTALSASPPSQHVSALLEEDISTGLNLTQGKSSILSVIFQHSQRGSHPTIRVEALQALRSVSHNYPSLVIALWRSIFDTVHELLQFSNPEESKYEISAGSWKGDLGNTLGSANERSNVAAIKVLDECLRATSGFQGTDDLLECKLLDIQFISDCTRRKKISSAPSYEVDALIVSKVHPTKHTSSTKQWCEVIEKHLPLILSHSSPMIRAAAVTCFAGMTSTIFFALEKDKQTFVICSAVSAALNDKVPSVRSAACRAIGVIACFPQIFCSAKTLDEFIHAVEFNMHDPLVSVRITSSWALANICDSLRHRATDLHLKESTWQVADSESISLLVECALQLTKDGDKIKSNAVRALGNLSRFVRFSHNSTVANGSIVSTREHITSQGFEYSQTSTNSGAFDNRQNSSNLDFAGDPNWLERMVQAFVSCVTTGNVKVQWNVCRALGNLFLNETLELQYMSWAPSVYSILLLLLRDSTNFKIRIHAAVALAVPSSRIGYGSSFSDVVQGLEHVLESMGSEQVIDSSSFKYKDSLVKQLTLTTLHVLGFASIRDDQALKDFLIKKASFLEQWLSSLCSSLLENSNQPEPENTLADSQRNGSVSHEMQKTMMIIAIRSLLEVYKCSNHLTTAQRLENLVDRLS